MALIKTNTLNDNHKAIVSNLWNNEYPKKLEHKNINEFEGYLASLTNQIYPAD